MLYVHACMDRIMLHVLAVDCPCPQSHSFATTAAATTNTTTFSLLDQKQIFEICPGFFKPNAIFCIQAFSIKNAVKYTTTTNTLRPFIGLFSRTS